MEYYFKIIGFCLFSTISQGQSFIFNQFFQPSLRINSLYNHDFNFLNKDRLHVGQADINCIIPIKSQLKLAVKWDKLLTLQLKKATQLKVYQLFWNFRPRVLYLDLSYQDNHLPHPFQQKPHITYGINTGLSGIHLIAKPFKQPKLFFYSVNIGLMEDYQSIQRTPISNITTMFGFAHLRNFNFYWYYGFFFSYNNGQIIPAPFFGIQAKLTKTIWVNITLPVQVRFAFKVSKKLKIDLSAGLSNFSTAFGYLNTNNQWERSVFGDLRIRGALTTNIKLSPQAILYLEAGCYAYQFPAFRWGNTTFQTPVLSPSVYGSLSLYYSFKKSLLGSTIDGIILF
ncbi:DUF6268 family outer membrane beta-barrel protein [Aureispira sp. CCB-QB1]|uniref:DUF6268 family outer membrane beta-barrel protein n=1 Tax=Aureispira sp. CCB-QB1 TaxID=1313421 RepID=UPI0006960F0F|nr:DUF6268 family outer membrane beta-barrel protein [Aureispira sp. CCB-QB1]